MTARCGSRPSSRWCASAPATATRPRSELRLLTADERLRRSNEADGWCRRAWLDQGGPDSGAALVAVGGYGRTELAPYSDLDVVLLHDEGLADEIVTELAQRVWYPLWDTGAKLDHSVRDLPRMVSAADADLRVMLGLLDARHLAGDPGLTLRLRTTMLTSWRRRARERLPELLQLVTTRHRLMGELAHVAVPDLKESEGGLRDTVVLRALVATWLVDAPHAELERSRQALLDLRDEVQGLAGRATDRINPEMWPDLAERLGLPDARAAQVDVRQLGRRVTHLSRLTWRRVGAVLPGPTSPAGGVRRPVLTPVAEHVALSGGEVVLDRTARPAQDPLLLLRAAAAASEHDAVLSPVTAARLARECAPLPEPWPAEARRLLVRMLAGPGLLGTWETLDETGALDRLLPEWERIRLAPHASVIHRYTVDRHVIETCIEASRLIRDVSRPDVLLIAALLHDIGKAGLGDHSIEGEPIARAAARRMGCDEEQVELVATLVRWHLLLAETATTRDPDDPATVSLVVDRIRDAEALTLLTALSEADARATSPKAWSSWRSELILDLSRRCRAALVTGAPLPPVSNDDVVLPVRLAEGSVSIEVEPAADRSGDGARVTAIAHDRIGLLADLAAMFALQRVPVRAARVWSQDGYGVTVWETADEDVDPAVLRQRFEAVAGGRIDPAQRLRPSGAARTGPWAPSVVVRPEASAASTVLEVRTTDKPGVLYLVCAALAAHDVEVRSAHVDTLGPQAVDVFYLQEPGAGVLGDERAAEAAHAVREALTPL